MKNYLFIIACALTGILSSCKNEVKSVPSKNEVSYFDEAWKQLSVKEDTAQDSLLIKVTGTESEFSIPAITKDSLKIGMIRSGKFILQDTTFTIKENSIMVEFTGGPRYIIYREDYEVAGIRVKIGNNSVRKENLSKSEIIDILKRI